MYFSMGDATRHSGHVDPTKSIWKTIGIRLAQM
jgi:hypothetical protein